MKRKNLTNIGRNIVAGCFAMVMIVAGIVVIPKEVTATTATKVIYDDGRTKTYKISDYWTESKDTRKAPVQDGYVFGGWYTKGEDGQHTPLIQEDLSDDTISNYDSTAYAKFVPAEVLSIKTQIGKSTDETTQKTITSMRILSTVDSKNYQGVGFEYRLATQNEGTTQNAITGEEITKVYSQIKQSKYSSTMYDPGKEFVSDVSKYFMAADVSEIGSRSFARIVYARPYWITMDGTKVMGLARNSRVEDKDTDKDYTSVGINLLPQLTTEKQLAAVAAGKIQITYNEDHYQVQSVDKTVDNSEGGVGGKYIFDEMEYRVDEMNGTIIFVGNAVTPNDNKLADGLFANIRFKKIKADDTTPLTLDVTTTNFCDWDEKDVEALIVQ